MRRVFHYSIAPRYTPGSPSTLDEGTFKRVRLQEVRAYEVQRDLFGEHDDADRCLCAIALCYVEHKGAFVITDTLTGEVFQTVSRKKLTMGQTFRAYNRHMHDDLRGPVLKVVGKFGRSLIVEVVASGRRAEFSLDGEALVELSTSL